MNQPTKYIVTTFSRATDRAVGQAPVYSLLELPSISRSLLISGPPGSGKTTALQILQRDAQKHRSKWKSVTFLRLSDFLTKDALRESVLKRSDPDGPRRRSEMVLLDGLDEVSPGSRVSVENDIAHLRLVRPSATIIVTSRPQVQTADPMAQFDHYEIRL